MYKNLEYLAMLFQLQMLYSIEWEGMIHINKLVDMNLEVGRGLFQGTILEYDWRN